MVSMVSIVCEITVDVIYILIVVCFCFAVRVLGVADKLEGHS